MSNIYIHVPFCRSKCDYCAFYSETGAGDELIDAYLSKLDRDLAQAGLDFPVETLYLGGGTPSILNMAQLERLFAMLRFRLDLSAVKEISMESNPETLTEAKLDLMRSFLTRLSMGVQSFSDTHRRTLGRLCRDMALEQALTWIEERKFPHWNLDLIYGIPGENEADFRRDLARIASTKADHFSAYNLTIEEQSVLGRGRKGMEPDGDFCVRCYEIAGEFAPFERYEISNYAKKGGRCLHNCRIWSGQKLYGFGPGASGFDGECRRSEVADLGAWLKGEGGEVDRLSPSARAGELWMVKLRMTDGWTRREWEEISVQKWEEQLEKSQRTAKLYPGCMEIGGDFVRLTGEGLLFWDTIAMEFLEE